MDEINKISEEIKNNKEQLVKLAERKRILSLFSDYSDIDRVVSFKELFEELKSLEQDIDGIKTNIPSLDKLTDGFREGNLVVVSGTTGSGKTALLQSFVREFSKKSVPSLFFTFEVPAKEFLRKFESEMPEIAYIPKQHKDSKILWLEERIIESIAKYDVKVVMIDHLHFLLDMKMLAGGNTSLLIGGLMRELKRIAIEYGIVIFLIAHTKKEKFNENEMPDITALRDSGMIACESDFVLFIDRKMTEDKMNWDNRAILFLAKNRWNGQTGWIDLIYFNNKFSEEEKNIKNETQNEWLIEKNQ